MGRLKYWLIILLSVVFLSGFAGNNKSEVYDSYVRNHMTTWKSIIDRLNLIPDKSNDLLFELINYQYGYIGWCLETGKKEEALGYLKLAEENTKILEEKDVGLSLVNAYKAAFYGFHIALSKFSAPFFGPKSSECARKAVSLDPNQPFGYIQLGNVKLHSPSLMGGSKTLAIKYFLKARLLMEERGNEIRGDWNYLNLMTMIAQTYESMGDYGNARQMYDGILKFEPDFTLVRDILYPQMLKKMNP